VLAACPRRIVPLAAIYFVVARLAREAAMAQKVVSSAWPPGAFAVAALLLRRARFGAALERLRDVLALAR